MKASAVEFIFSLLRNCIRSILGMLKKLIVTIEALFAFSAGIVNLRFTIFFGFKDFIGDFVF